MRKNQDAPMQQQQEGNLSNQVAVGNYCSIVIFSYLDVIYGLRATALSSYYRRGWSPLA